VVSSGVSAIDWGGNWGVVGGGEWGVVSSGVSTIDWASWGNIDGRSGGDEGSESDLREKQVSSHENRSTGVRHLLRCRALIELFSRFNHFSGLFSCRACTDSARCVMLLSFYLQFQYIPRLWLAFFLFFRLKLLSLLARERKTYQLEHFEV
jgi:hypothetical protein